jgi:hypothetical protein
MGNELWPENNLGLIIFLNVVMQPFFIIKTLLNMMIICFTQINLKMNLLKQVIFIFTCFIFVSCGEMLHRQDDIYIYLNDYSRKIADFKKGSYWVYYSDTMNAFDTVSVTGYSHEYEKNPFDNYFYCLEYVKFAFRSTFHSCNIEDKLSVIDYNGNIVYIRRYTNCTGKKEHDFSLGISNEGYIPGVGTSYNIEDFNLNGESITDIVCYTKTINDTMKCKYYFAKDYGVVKMEFKVDSILTKWNLVECNIIK